jgi:opacity protein-like surface antigen
VLGVEADIAFVPGFFEGEAVDTSLVTTMMGNVVVAAPLGVAQYGLRPYVTAGAGLLRARGDNQVGGPVISSNLFGMNVGGGAIGPLTPRSSLRLDLRYFRDLDGDPEAITAPNEGVELSFWRGTVGLTFRF